ncbi:MAG: ATP-binding cassette domain-containing protein [Thermomicrobiales bacterium]
MDHVHSAILAHDVHKRYAGGAINAGLHGFNLAVAPGTVCGLLGPNGAGKTTVVRILSTLLRMDSGEASVAGCDVRRQARQVRERIGLVGQYAAVDEILSGRENLEMFGRLNHLPGRVARARAEELLAQFALSDAANQSVRTYSGGMRRRLDLAASLIVSPPVLFVDEPTTGLDPAARREVWAAIRSLVHGGSTVLLTTQYLEEADALANQIVLLKAGRVIAEGTPRELKATLGESWLDITLPDEQSLATAQRILASLPGVQSDPDRLRLSLPAADGARSLVHVASLLDEAAVAPLDIGLRQPTLDDVFLHLTVDTQEEVAA